jgi:hypothetical protein
VKPAGTELRLRDVLERLARTLGAAQPVGSTIHEWDWAAKMYSLAATLMLLSGGRRFKPAENDPWTHRSRSKG